MRLKRPETIALDDADLLAVVPFDVETTQEFYLPEGLVRGRLTDIEIATIARHVGLDLRDVRSWEYLEQLTALSHAEAAR